MTLKRRIGGVLPLLLVLMLTAGCGGGGAVSLPGPDPTTLALSAPTPKGLTAALRQDKSTITVTKGTVNYTLILTNGTQNPVAVAMPQDSGGSPLPPVALFIKSSAGEVVYPSPATGAPVPGGGSQTLTLQPGDFVQQTLQLTNLFQVIGRYNATATFTTGSGQTTVGPLVLTAR